MPGLNDLENRMNELEEAVERQRIIINEMQENLIKMFDAVIQLGFRGENHEERITELENNNA